MAEVNPQSLLKEFQEQFWINLTLFLQFKLVQDNQTEKSQLEAFPLISFSLVFKFKVLR